MLFILIILLLILVLYLTFKPSHEVTITLLAMSPLLLLLMHKKQINIMLKKQPKPLFTPQYDVSSELYDLYLKKQQVCRKPQAGASTYTNEDIAKLYEYNNENGDSQLARINHRLSKRAKESLVNQNKQTSDTFREYFEEELEQQENRHWWENEALDIYDPE
jgi:hypothetical protein